MLAGNTVELHLIDNTSHDSVVEFALAVVQCW